MRFNFVKMATADLVTALQKAGLSANPDDLKRSAETLLQNSIENSSTNGKKTSPLSLANRQDMANKFGGIRLCKIGPGDDPVVDVPPTGSPEFSAFVSDAPMPAFSEEDWGENFEKFIINIIILLSRKPISKEYSLRSRLTQIRQKTSDNNYVTVAVFFEERHARFDIEYTIGGQNIKMAINMGGEITSQYVEIDKDNSSAQRVADAFAPNAHTVRAALKEFLYLWHHDPMSQWNSNPG